jgi:hypothetical protein
MSTPNHTTPDAVRTLRKWIQEQRALLFMPGYLLHREEGTAENVFFPIDPGTYESLWMHWRSLLPLHAPPVMPKVRTANDAHKALDLLLRRLEELFGPVPAGETPEASSALGSEPHADKPKPTSIADATAIHADAKRKATVNARMIDVLGKEPDAKSWTVKQWQERLKCSGGAVVGTNVWKSMKLEREQHKAERTRDRRQRKKHRGA